MRVRLKCVHQGIPDGTPGRVVEIDDGWARKLVEAGNAEYVAGEGAALSPPVRRLVTFAAGEAWAWVRQAEDGITVEIPASAEARPAVGERLAAGGKTYTVAGQDAQGVLTCEEVA